MIANENILIALVVVAVVVVVVAVVVVVVASLVTILGTKGSQPPCRARLAYYEVFNRLLVSTHHHILDYMVLGRRFGPTMRPYLDESKARIQTAWNELALYCKRAGSCESLGKLAPTIATKVKAQIDNNYPLQIAERHCDDLSEILVSLIGGNASEGRQAAHDYLESWERVHSHLSSGNVSGAYDVFAKIKFKASQMAISLGDKGGCSRSRSSVESTKILSHVMEKGSHGLF